MTPYRPPYAARLGQSWSDLTGGVTSGMAKDIVREAEPAARRIIGQERHRFATAVINGLPFFGLAAMAYIGTRYFVPDEKKTAKGAGYLAAAAATAVGGWYTVSQLKSTELPETSSAPGTPASGTVNSIANSAAKAIVAEAEPKIRAIVDEERARIAEAGQVAVPLVIGSFATFLATMFLVSPEKNVMKAAGYSGSALLLGAGIWMGLDKEREAA